MKITDIEELKNMARIIRKGIIEQVYSANSGHPGGSLSIADRKSTRLNSSHRT